MKPIIISMNEMSDSREVYESKPSIIIPVFIYICLVLLIAAFLWMGFGRIDIVVKSSGMIRPNESVSTVVNVYSGKIEELYIKDGDTVAKEQLLYVIEHNDLLLNKEYYEQQISYYNQQIDTLNLYQKSIIDGVNYFTDSVENFEYEIRYQNFQIQVDSLKRQNEFNKNDLDYQTRYLSEQIAYYEKEKKNNSRLLDSIQQGKNLFSEKQENYYNNKYELFVSDYKGLEKKYEDAKQEIELSIRQESLVNSLEYYQEVQSGLRKFKKSVQLDKDQFDKNSIYRSQFNSYIQKRTQLYESYKRCFKTYEVNQELKGIAVSEWEVEESKIASENAKKEYEQFKENTILDIETQLNDVNQKLKDTHLSKESILTKDTLLEQNNIAKETALSQFQKKYQVELQATVKSIEETLMSLKDKLEGVKRSKDSIISYSVKDSDDKEYAQVMKYRNDEIQTVINALEGYENQKKELLTNLEKTNQSIESCYVKASCDGVINTSVDLVVGDVLSAQREVLTILPNNDTEYKGVFFVSNSNIGKIKEGMVINANVYAYPNSEYGYLKGTITKVSNDIKVNSQTGEAYYQVEAKLDTNGFYDKDGTKLSMKAGMSCEAKIITEDKSILVYVLEKLKLWVTK